MKSPEPEEADPTPDAELVALARAGDTLAFDRLITRHRTRVHSMILSMLRNETDAWDVSQEAFIRAWRSLSRFRGESSFSTWLHRIATNCSLDWLRRSRLRAVTPFDTGEDATDPIDAAAADTATPVHAAERAELRSRIEAALARLSPEHRAVILLKEVEGFKYAEIANAVGCSLGTVMSRLFHARRNLQKLLAQNDD